MFSNLWRVPQSIFILKNFYKKQQDYTLPFLKPIFDKVPKEVETLSKAEWRRIKDYPMLFIVLFVELFAELREQALSEQERARLTLFSAGLAIYDDFFDNTELSADYILDIYQHPQHIFENNSINTESQHNQKISPQEKVFYEIMQVFYANFENTHPNYASFQSKFKEFWRFQQQSRLQLQASPKLSPALLREISFGKGGTALLLSRLLMDNPPTDFEAKMVEEMGAWFQWFDDIVDIAQDLQKPAQTLIINANTIAEARKEVFQITKKVFLEMKKLPYKQSLITKITHQFFVISTSGWIHLAQLEKLEKKTNHVFMPFEYTHKQVLWQQNDIKNIWRALWVWSFLEF